jgi:hypothetical protein
MWVHGGRGWFVAEKWGPGEWGLATPLALGGDKKWAATACPLFSSPSHTGPVFLFHLFDFY